MEAKETIDRVERLPESNRRLQRSA